MAWFCDRLYFYLLVFFIESVVGLFVSTKLYILTWNKKKQCKLNLKLFLKSIFFFYSPYLQHLNNVRASPLFGIEYWFGHAPILHVISYCWLFAQIHLYFTLVCLFLLLLAFILPSPLVELLISLVLGIVCEAVSHFKSILAEKFGSLL